MKGAPAAVRSAHSMTRIKEMRKLKNNSRVLRYAMVGCFFFEKVPIHFLKKVNSTP
jgi:hypothetical protein